jgi:excisionase family DNA binding protein
MWHPRKSDVGNSFATYPQLPDRLEATLIKVAYSIADAAAATATTEATITEAIRDRTLQARAAGKQLLVTHADLTEWVESLPSNDR